MAIQKTISKKGANLSYHRIINPLVNKNSTSFTVLHYVDADNRAERDNNYIFKTNMSLPCDDSNGDVVENIDVEALKAEGVNQYTAIYSVLKANAFDDVDLSGATDV